MEARIQQVAAVVAYFADTKTVLKKLDIWRAKTTSKNPVLSLIVRNAEFHRLEETR